MENIKFYQRKRKDIKEEKVQLDVHQTWVPETPVKHGPAKPYSVYAKRKLTGNAGPSFLARICKEEAKAEANNDNFGPSFLARICTEEAEADNDNSKPIFLARICEEEAEADNDMPVMTSAGEKEHKSQSSDFSCLISDASLDLNKTICDREDAATAVSVSNLTEGSENFLPESGMFDHRGGGICTSIKESNGGLIDRSAPLDDLSHSLELSSYPNIAPPGECATNNTGSLPLKNESNNPDCHATECGREKGLQWEDVHCVNQFEPQTPLIKHNKRPCNGRDINSRPTKKKRHRPKVVVDCVPRRPIKNSPPKKEKMKCGRITQPPKKKEKKTSVRKNQSAIMLPATLELPSIHSTNYNVSATSDLNLETKSTVKCNVGENGSVTNDEKIVGVVQSGVERGLETVDTGDHKSDRNMMLLAIPVIPTPDLNLETKSTSQSHVVTVEMNNGCPYTLRNRQPKKELGCGFMSSCGHKQASKVNLCFRNSIKKELSFPKMCKKTRMKRKRRPKLSIILYFFQIKGHIKKKRSKRYLQLGLLANLFKQLSLVEEQGVNLECYEQLNFGGLVLNNPLELQPKPELKSGEPRSRMLNPVEAQNHGKRETENCFEMRQFPVYPELQNESLYEQNLCQLIEKSTGIQEASNHKDIIIKKEKEIRKRRTNHIYGEFMLPIDEKVPHQNSLSTKARARVPNQARKTSGRVRHQGSLSPQKGAIVPYQSSLSIKEGAIVPHQGSSSSQKGAIVLHNGPLSTKKFKPVIDIDPETMRRWYQVKRIEDGLGEEKEEVDEETKNRWEEDRKMFEGRIELFNKKMHEVLGDRRFKPWKGSVVDSVVGVFLTQNVSDFLSSSAYMSLAAKFPNETSHQEEFHCSQKLIGSTNGTTRDLPGKQYIVTETTDDEGGLGDIEDIGKPNLARGMETTKPLPSLEMMHGTEPCSRTYPRNFCDFCQSLCSSSGAFHESDNSEIIGYYRAENTIEDKALPDASVLPQDCSSQAEVGAEINLNSGCCSQAGVEIKKSLDSLDMEHKASVLPQDCNSEAEVVTEKNLHLGCCSQDRVGIQKSLDSVDMQHKAFVLPQDCSSHAVGTEKNLDSGGCSQAGVRMQKSLDSIDMQHKAGLEEARKTTPRKKIVAKKKEVEKKDWDRLRRMYSKLRSSDCTDTVDWKAVREADVNVIAEVIKARGQQSILAERIKGFLDRVVLLHGSIDLEWLRYAPPLIVKEYLLDVQGLGLKSVECIRLLELGHIAFPVDVNVARILVRIGWVPLKPLPGNLQFHLLEEYPIMDSVQKYLWPRLREFDTRTLYEFHYQLITFGKIFCKKRSPNCNSCPMRAECRHFASAVAASANLHLPGPTNKDLERSMVPTIPVVDTQSLSDNFDVNPNISMSFLEFGVTSDCSIPVVEYQSHSDNVEVVNPNTSVSYLESGVTSNLNILVVDSQSLSDNDEVNPNISVTLLESGVTSDLRIEISDCVPLIEEPKSPEQVQNIKESDVSEDSCEDNDADDNILIDNEKEQEIPTISLNNEEFRKNVLFYWEKYHNNPEDGNSSRALVLSTVDVNSVSVHKLKRTNHLRTEHQVYEIPDGHEILEGLERRDPEDSVPYLLAIWTAGETPNSVEQPKKKCNSQGSELCNDQTCFACQSICEGNADIVRGTILIPCRTAMRGRFPLNGTYFQVNEVFADHETSQKPLIIPRNLIWYLRRRMVFFGTSPSAIFTKNCSLLDIQRNFWTGFICLRGFDRKTRAPKPLAPRFHCSPSKMEKAPRRVNPDKMKSKPEGFNQEKGNDVNKSEGAI